MARETRRVPMERQLEDIPDNLFRMRKNTLILSQTDLGEKAGEIIE